MKWGTTVDARLVRQQIARAMRTAPGPGPVQFDMPQSEPVSRLLVVQK